MSTFPRSLAVATVLVTTLAAQTSRADDQLPPVRYNQFMSPLCPTDNDIRNMDVRLSARVIPPDNKVALLAERAKAHACRRTGGEYNHKDWERMRAVTNGDS